MEIHVQLILKLERPHYVHTLKQWLIVYNSLGNISLLHLLSEVQKVAQVMITEHMHLAQVVQILLDVHAPVLMKCV